MSNRKPRILLVDDEIDIIESLAEFLDSEFDITIIDDGFKALEIFKNQHFDLVITDFSMPGMNGVTLCKEIKRLSKETYVPVVLITGMSDQDQELAAFNAGVDDFLAKPFSAPILLAKCRVMTRVKHQHDQLEHLNKKLEERVASQVLELQKVNQLKKYFSPRVLKQMIEDDAIENFGSIPIRSQVTIMFCDIRNFSKVSDDISQKM